MRDIIRFSLAAFGTVTVLATAYPALANTVEERRAKGAAVVSKLNNGVPQNNLENMRREFPFLAEATEAYALGDVWSRPGLDDRTRPWA
jgi:4-carboxymuconolactone decarboxylase